MPAKTLTDVYVDKLKDLYSAEQQILKALPKLVKAATHEDLQNAFETHRRQTKIHVERLDQIFEALGKAPRGKTCQGMQGIIEEGAELIKEKSEPVLLDAGLIAGAQSVEHYEMAGYGSARTWAQQLGYDEHAALLQQTLDEEKQTDELLTRLAEQSVNPDAEIPLYSDREVVDTPRRRSTTKRGADRSHHRPASKSE
jgi:ferritin-like metal-binding protein YciE